MTDRWQGRRLVAAARLHRYEREVERAIGRALARRKAAVESGALTAAAKTPDPFGADAWDTDLDDEVVPVVRRMFDHMTTATLKPFPLTAGQESRVLGLIDVAGQVDNFMRLVRGIGPQAATRINEELAQGVGLGEGIPKLAERVDDVFAMAERRATTIARTEVVRASNATSHGAAGAVNGEIPLTKTWLSTSDEATRETHADADGQTVAYNEPFVVGGYECAYPCDPDLPAEESINCVVGSTVVAWHGALRAVFRSWYSGDVLELVTRNGERLTVTPNHPILTDTGWVAAKGLQVGDKIGAAAAVPCGVEPYVNNVPTSIKQVYRAAREKWPQTRVGGLGVHFYGDVVDSEIQVVRPDGDLFAEPDARADQILGHEIFMGLAYAEGPFLSPRSYDVLGSRAEGRSSSTPRVGHIADGGVSCRREPPSVLHAGSGHAYEHGFGATTDRQAECGQAATNGPAVAPEDSGHCEHGHPVVVQLAELVQINVGAFAGHVFTLETETGWYTGNAVAVKNCRCVPIYEATEDTAAAEAAIADAEAESG